MPFSAAVLKTVQGKGSSVSKAANACITACHKHTLTAGEGKVALERTRQQPCQKMHQVVGSQVAATAYIPLPPNVEELQASEKARFSPRRTRDTSSAHIATKVNQVGSVFSAGFMGSQGSQGSSFNTSTIPVDSHLDVYDRANAVSLSSVMQTNVPKPFGIKGKAPVHLNMPGGQWSQDDKYVSGELQQHHHSTITSVKKPGISATSHSSSGVRLGLLDPRAPWNNSLGNRRLVTWCGNVRIDDLGSSCYPTCHNNVCLSNNPAMCNRYMYGTELMGNVRFFHACNVQKQSSNESQQENAPKAQLSSKQKLQRAVKEYGTTVIVFHVSISLASLGICYLLVSSGVDMTGFIKSLGINLDSVNTGASEVMDQSQQVGVTEAVNESGEGDASKVAEKKPESDSDINTARAAGAATFVVAYAVHKIFAPARIAITLTSTPFIVRHLRKIGFLKPPKAKGN
ncbi:uncharacterized protein LOC125033470 [Penaeus chinensis]|uniref:uncharacterized protein LOC125033470 n=1 Tax=Penaeus chinensis TaxID=139456 RepID=UPI001FB737AD|nr:uncharacterized protein LOC125033470 [Penaeus chinensis]